MNEPTPQPHRRRPRYAGKNPRRFEEKYKEHQPELHPETVQKVLASGKTPAGMHRPILLSEILEILHPKPGDLVADCTIGYGGHAQALLERIQPGGRLIGLDADPIELPKAEARLRALGYGPEQFSAHRCNYAALSQVIAEAGCLGVDLVLADLGVSSMQLDDPSRGFSIKNDGPLDMRMNPKKGISARALLEKSSVADLQRILEKNADEPRATILARALAGKSPASTLQLAQSIRTLLSEVRSVEEKEKSVRRVFQALRIEVNDEFAALDTFLRLLPSCLNRGARVAILTFHSGEDRRVKEAFERGSDAGHYSRIAEEVIRPSVEEQKDNPRSTSAKLRWAFC